MTQLSKSFSLAELTRSQKAQTLGIKNTAPPEVVARMKELCVNLLQPIRDDVGRPIRVNSGYRSPALNAAVGGVKNSAHLTGYAVDIVCPDYGNAKKFCIYIRDFLKENNIPFDQLIYEYGTWVHLGYKSNAGLQRRQVLTINKRGKFVGIVD